MTCSCRGILNSAAAQLTKEHGITIPEDIHVKACGKEPMCGRCLPHFNLIVAAVAKGGDAPAEDGAASDASLRELAERYKVEEAQTPIGEYPTYKRFVRIRANKLSNEAA